MKSREQRDDRQSVCLCADPGVEWSRVDATNWDRIGIGGHQIIGPIADSMAYHLSNEYKP